MMVMTAKVDFKKLLGILGAVVGVIIALILIFGGSEDSATTAANAANNDSRVQFLKEQGWEVAASPAESGQVRIPREDSELFSRYNALQKNQGYDLSPYAGKTVMRYVYKVTNYPNATEPVYATLLVYKDQIIGGDITDTSATGKIHGFRQFGSDPKSDSTPKGSL